VDSQVETYFNKTAVVATYWIGLFKSGSIYYWQGGGFAGTGITSDANPYGEFVWVLLSALTC
jgi:hypothetical protein